MRNINMILCEGETDQVLMGAYIMRTTNWEWWKLKDPPFSKQGIAWYKDKNDSERVMGIWLMGGNDFIPAVREIAKRAKYESSVSKLLIVTDHDDDIDAERERPEGIYSVLCSELGAQYNLGQYSLHEWSTINFTDRSGEKTHMQVYYLLVPADSKGALETFMLNALSEKDEEKKKVIKCAKKFVKFVSEKREYLKSRRDKIKAELGVSLAVFSPDKAFSTMKEIIDSVDWTKFDSTQHQFQVLKQM